MLFGPSSPAFHNRHLLRLIMSGMTIILLVHFAEYHLLLAQKAQAQTPLATKTLTTASMPMTPTITTATRNDQMIGLTNGNSSNSNSTSSPQSPANSSTVPALPFSSDLVISLKIGLFFANSTKALRTLFGFGQSAPAVTLALRRARDEHLIDSVNVTYANFCLILINCD